MHAVERWFGTGFYSLHPLLQELHRNGGSLQGEIQIRYGKGTAGWLGKRIARRFGLPHGVRDCHLRVEIFSDQDGLHWNRTFNHTHTIKSVFTPVGSWPEGYWTERTGQLRVDLLVETTNGGWYWHPIRTYLSTKRLPNFLVPKLTAYKQVVDEKYEFHVSASVPLLGVCFSYAGRLTLI